MTFKHLSENLKQQARGWNIALGVSGFRYADLNRVRRLEALDRAFLRGTGWRVADVELIGTEHLAGDRLTYVSDHFGLKIDLVPAQPGSNLPGS